MPMNGEAQRELEDHFPRADPTPVAWEQIRREVMGLRELVETRLGAMDKATELLADTVGKVPSETDKAIEHLKSLHDEKFHSIQTQFTERDVRAERESRDNKIAVDAAFAAAKEQVNSQNIANNDSIAKTEASTTKQIDGISAQMLAGQKATDDKINDIKEQLAGGRGRRDQEIVTRSGNQWATTTALGVIVALAIVVSGILGALHI